MSLPEILGVVGEAVSRRASVESVVGAPVVVGDRTYLPLARVQYGFGGGDNLGVIGSGGGMEAVPLGLIELGPAGVTYHPLPAFVSEVAAGPTVREVADGVFEVDNGPELPRSWLLVHGDEAAVVNAPPLAALATTLIQQVAGPGAQVRYVLLTSGDYAHAGGVADLLRVFPQARLVGHRALQHSPNFPPRPGQGEPEGWRAHVPADGVEVHGFDQQVWGGGLGGEPLFVIYAPSRDWTDQLILFRGALLSGPSRREGVVPLEVRAQVREQLAEILDDSYRIHTTAHSSGSTSPGLDPSLLD